MLLPCLQSLLFCSLWPVYIADPESAVERRQRSLRGISSCSPTYRLLVRQLQHPRRCLAPYRAISQRSGRRSLQPSDTVISSSAQLRYTRADHHHQTFLYYAIYSARPGPNAHEDPKEFYTLAGGLAIFRTSEEDQSAEIGHVTIFPEFQVRPSNRSLASGRPRPRPGQWRLIPHQRTHVLTHAAGLLMHRILDDGSLGGMNLRRCQWFTNSLNKPSQAAALRLGYTFEGILRSHRMLPVGKRGAHGEYVPPIIPVFRNMPLVRCRADNLHPIAGRKGEFEAQNSRDSWLSSVTWEEWEGGVRDHVDKLMIRRE